MPTHEISDTLIRAPQVRNEAPEHVSEVLVQARNRDFFVRLDVLAFARCRQMSTGFQRRSAGDHEVVGEVAIGALAKAFSDMARNLARRFGQLFVEIEISDQLRPLQEWRNRIDPLECPVLGHEPRHSDSDDSPTP